MGDRVEQGINAVGRIGFRAWKAGERAGGIICCKPVVVGKGEGSREGIGADVEGLAYGRAVVEDEVVVEVVVAAGQKARGATFLEDAQHPAAGVDDGVVAEMAVPCAGEGDGAIGSEDEIVPNGDMAGLPGSVLGAEKGLSGGAADVNGSLAGVFEVAVMDEHMGGATLALRSGCLAETCFPKDPAAGDFDVVAAYQIDGLAAPAMDVAVEDAEVLDSGTFDRVKVAGGAGVFDAEVFEGDVVAGPLEMAGIIDVDAVVRLPGE